MNEFWVSIATLIGTILIFLQTNKSQKVTYLSEEEAKWRESLRKIIISLRSSKDKKRIVKELDKLTPLLNPLGKSNRRIGTRQVYSVDSHIWLLREQILEKFDKEKLNRLVDYLELLLKFDWEDSKNKLKYRLFDAFIICSLIFYCLLFILWIIQPEWIDKNGDTVPILVPYLGLGMILLSLGLFLGNTHLGINKAMSTFDIFLTIFFIVSYILPTVGLIYRYNEKIVEVLQILPFLSDVNKSHLTNILIGSLFLFEIIFLLVASSMKNQYYLSILGVDYPYLTQVLKDIYSHLKQDNRNRYLLKEFSKLDQHFAEDKLTNIQPIVNLEKAIDDIDLTYLWELTLYRKIIRQLLRYRRYENDRSSKFYVKRLKEQWNNNLEK